MLERKCTKCRKLKTVDQFYPSACYCKSCHLTYSKNRRKRLKDELNLKDFIKRGSHKNPNKLTIAHVGAALKLTYRETFLNVSSEELGRLYLKSVIEHILSQSSGVLGPALPLFVST